MLVNYKKEHMKKVFTVVIGISLVSAAFMFQGCNKLKALLQYDLYYTTADATFTIYAIQDTIMHTGVGATTVNINVDSFIKANTSNQLDLSSIKHAYLESCTMNLTNADSTNNFANFKTCAASFSTDLNSSVVTIGTITNNPDVFASSIVVPIDSTIDYATYLGAHTISYSVDGKARRFTTTSLTGHITLKFKIHVQG